ncbi:MAG: DUF364 domain-containing protein [Halobacteriota archaeon]|nr:DUF364 domain-containing protein [Halobacteriota archaeon]
MEDTDLLSEIISELSDAEVSDVRLCGHWAAVISKGCGLAHSYDVPGSVKDTGYLTEKTALELCEYSKSWNLKEASIGVAAINSLIEPRADRGDGFEILKEYAKEKKVAIVGHFPKVVQIKEIAEEVWVFEKSQQEGDLPDTAAEYLLPKADVVAITGSAVVNKSIERLLELSNAFTMVLGPTTPMSPVLFDYGADLLAGCRVVNSERLMKKVSEGASCMKEIKNEIEFIVMER